MSQAGLDNKLQAGIKLARAGQLAEAEAIFDKLLSANALHQEALVWKAAVTSDAAVSVACLEKVLRLNPESQRAKQGLRWARQRLETSYQAQNGAAPAPVPTAASSATKSAATLASPKNQAATPTEHPTSKSGPPRPPPTAQPEQNSQPILTSQTTKRTAKAETITEAATYKKSRLSSPQENFAEVKLPPEAYAGSIFGSNEPTKKRSPRATQTRRAGKNQPGIEAEMTSGTSAMRAAMPKFKLRVAEHVAQMAEASYEVARSPRVLQNAALPWYLFGAAVGFALLTFVLTGLAVLLGALALLLAIVGVALYIRT